MTLEEAQAEILRLNEELTATANERDSFSSKIETLSTDLEKVRNLNQQYFLKLSAQYNPQATPEADDPEIQPCEEFAKTINI